MTDEPDGESETEKHSDEVESDAEELVREEYSNTERNFGNIEKEKEEDPEDIGGLEFTLEAQLQPVTQGQILLTRSSDNSQSMTKFSSDWSICRSWNRSGGTI